MRTTARTARTLPATTLVALLFVAANAHGAGFGLNEHGARAMGMAGAYTAIADAPETIFFNPAGIATLSGLQLEAGVTLIAPAMSYTGPMPGTNTQVSVDGVKHLFFLPNFHGSYRVHDRFAVGFGLYVPYGLTTEWDKTINVNGTQVGWWGRGISQKIGLQTVYLNPTIAAKLHPRIFLGAGLTITKAAVDLNRAVTLSANPADDIDIRLAADTWGVGATAGLLVKVLPELLNAGFTFRSGTNLTFSGNGAFQKNGSGAEVPAGLRTQLTDGPVEAKLNLPNVFSFGLAAFPAKPLTIGFGFDVIMWSSYDKLEITFKENAALSSSEPKLWNNTICVRIGAEYRVLPQLPLRVGFIFDQAPPPPSTLGPDLPDGDRYEFTLGGGYEFKGFRVDLAYQFLTSGKIRNAETAPLPGEYTSLAHLVGLSLGFKHDL